MLKIGHKINDYTVVAAWLMQAGRQSDHIVILGHHETRESDQFVVSRIGLDDEPTFWDQGNYTSDHQKALRTFMALTGLGEILLQNPAPPTIQVLHGRDPDSECDVRVWLDDTEATGFEVEDIDPGRGYNREDWDDRIASAKADASSFGRARLAMLLDNASSEHIRGESARPTTTCGCGHELVWVGGAWEHNVAPYIWGDDHDPHPDDDNADPEGRRRWDKIDGIETDATEGETE